MLAFLVAPSLAPVAFADAIKQEVASAATLNAPAISGELFDLTKADLTVLKTQNAVVSRSEGDGKPAIKAEFSASDAWPNVRFPHPQGGWDLSDYAGVQVEIQNVGASDTVVSLRVDNAGPWQEAPWNMAMATVPAGATKVIKVVFGQQNVFPLDTSRIVGIQVNLNKPKEPNTLLIRDLKAYGSAKDRPATGGFSVPADRDKLVVPAAWVGTKPPVEGDWVRTFDENFDGPKLNDKLWNSRTWWNGYIPNQLERYSAENLVFKEGILSFKVEKRAGHMYDDPTLTHREYTSAYLNTFDKWTQLYGYFEARIKLPTTRGLWPAFWMMPDRGRGETNIRKRSPTDGSAMEIDIMEQLAEWGPGRYNVAAHWDNYGPEHKRWGSSFNYFGATPDGWHTFGALWEPGKITWFCDGIKKAEWSNPRVGSVPMFMILQVQMGGWATKEIDDAKLPDAMQVDYVRAWQLKHRITP